MASSKNKLTEEQLTEGLFDKILSGILQRRTKKVIKVLQGAPNIQKKAKELDDAVSELRLALKRAK
jgi:hypothetical protein